ncbi:Fc.00g107070.m01.CDS01 [Cosmosporella sp. VM-42]
MQGSILKTPYVEIRGISGGFGLGSLLTLPPVTEIQHFPLLVGATPNPFETFAKLRGLDNSPRYITEANGASWLAVGVLATACETVDVPAVLTLPLSTDINQINILGTALASFPSDKEPEKALASIKLNVKGTIDIARGFLLFQGQISDDSFLLSKDCHPSGGLIVGGWFGSSPQAGDRCISIGGWHPAYVALVYYLAPLLRLGIVWRYTVSVLYSTGALSANFDFRADFIRCMHPIHYDARVNVSAGLWYELEASPIRQKIALSLGAELRISGPPFGGMAYFDACVVRIPGKFGEQRGPPNALSLKEFLDVCLKKANAREPHTDHVLSLESGAVAPSKVSNEVQTSDTPWAVRGPVLALSVVSRIPSMAIDLPGAVAPSRQMIRSILSRPMQLEASSQGLTAPLTVKITRKGSGGIVANLSFEVIEEMVPASL